MTLLLPRTVGVLLVLCTALVQVSIVYRIEVGNASPNLLILVVCGRPTENILGMRGLVILYVVGAYAAAAAQYFAGPAETAPMIGASGAISAVLGAYALLFGRNRVKVANPTLALWLHAAWLAAAWVGLQLLVGFTFRTEGVGIAIAAHIGGFLAGLLLAKPLLMLRWRGA